MNLVFSMLVSLDFWILLWKATFIGGVLLFGGMAVFVTIGGYFDIKRLFAQMAADRNAELQQDASADRSDA